MRAGPCLAGAIVLCHLSSGPAIAGSYPETALSLALSTPPELVDEASLLFQLPSRAGVSPTQLFAFTNSPYYYSTYSNSLGVVGQTHGQGFFLLSQPASLFERETAFQAGWGGAWRWLRLGAAARGTTSESESSGYQTGSSVNEATAWEQQEHWEASVGLGFGGDRFALDVAVDLQRFEERNQQFSTGSSPRAIDLVSDDDLSAGVSGRFQARFANGIEVTGAGGWSHVDGEVTGTQSRNGVVDSVAVGRMFENWSGGIAVRFPGSRIDQITVAAHWSHREIVPYYREEFTKSITARRQLAISVQDQLWRALHFQSGISLRYEEEGLEQVYDSYYQESWYETETTALRSEFGWGVSYSWKYFEGRVTLTETLPLNDFFAAVDFFVHL